MGAWNYPEEPDVFAALYAECKAKRHEVENLLPKSGQLEELRKLIANTSSNAAVANWCQALGAEVIYSLLTRKPREPRVPVDKFTKLARAIHKDFNGAELDAVAALKGSVLPQEPVRAVMSVDEVRDQIVQALTDQRSSTARTAAAGGFHSTQPTH